MVVASTGCAIAVNHAFNVIPIKDAMKTKLLYRVAFMCRLLRVSAACGLLEKSPVTAITVSWTPIHGQMGFYAWPSSSKALIHLVAHSVANSPAT